MARIRGKDTGPELKVRRLVHGLGYRYRKHRRDLPGRPDMAFAGRHKVVFIHGCFWHRHDCALGRRLPKSRLDFWLPKLERNRERDARVLEQLRTVGWDALVVWECETRDTSALADRLKSFLSA